MVKRSSSVPAPASAKVVAPTSKTPIGAKKKQPAAIKAKPAMKQITNGAAGPGTSKTAVTTTAGKKTAPLSTPSTRKPLSSTTAKQNALPKPYPDASAAKPSQRRPAAEKKTAVKPGLPKPFSMENKAAGAATQQQKKTYPGTNTYVGQGSRTPVKKYKPLPRMEGTAEKGKVQHIQIGRASCRERVF